MHFLEFSYVSWLIVQQKQICIYICLDTGYMVKLTRLDDKYLALSQVFALILPD